MSRLPDPVRTFSKEFADLKRRFRDLEVRSAWSGSGMAPLGDGTTSFDPGLIPNNALGSPSIPGAAGVEATNFGLTPALAEVAGVNLTVPTGITSLTISATAHVFVIDSTLVDDGLWVSLSVGSASSTPIGMPLGAGGFTTASCSLGTVVAGLTPGASVRLGVWASSSTGTHLADVDNTAAIAASLTWQP